MKGAGRAVELHLSLQVELQSSWVSMLGANTPNGAVFELHLSLNIELGFLS